MTTTENPMIVNATDLVPRESTGVIVGATPEAILGNATRIADALKGLIESQGLSRSVGGDRKHVEVGGWQAAGAMLGALGGIALHAETVWSRRVPRDDAIVYESRCEVRTLDGEVVGAAESLCSSEERNWRKAEEYAVKGMAETRAESRAYRRAIGWVVNLAGYNPTPAEEVPVGGEGASPGGEKRSSLPAWAAPVQDIGGVAQSLVRLLQTAGLPEGAAAEEVGGIGQKVFDDCEDTIPLCVARVINHITDALRAAPAEPPEDTPGEPMEGQEALDLPDPSSEEETTT